MGEAQDAYIGAGTSQHLRESLLDDGQFLFTAIRPDGTVVFASEASTKLLGREPVELVGENIVDLLAPDDVERAILQLTSADGTSVLTGITRFKVRHKDGSWRPLEVFGAPVTDGVEDLIGIYARNGLHQVVVEEILSELLRGADRTEVLSLVCDVIQWQGAGSHLAISWQDSGGRHQVSTGIGDELSGGDDRSGLPWARSRSGARESNEGSVDDLPVDLAAAARASGVSLFWVEPVAWSDRHEPALITIWTAGGQRTPQLHAYGMGIARNMVELILRWTEQVADMSYAARIDALTGLANRRTFFTQLQSGDSKGAILYCDLDRFKPVNDSYGHPAGDLLLRLVARRLEACVREGDLVSRLGGDEFAVLCDGASDEEALEVAERIRASLEEPFDLDGRKVQISVSIGLAMGTGGLDEEVLGQADRALLEAKSSGRATVRRG